MSFRVSATGTVRGAKTGLPRMGIDPRNPHYCALIDAALAVLAGIPGPPEGPETFVNVELAASQKFVGQWYETNGTVELKIVIGPPLEQETQTYKP